MVLTAAATYPDRIAAAASFHGGRLATDARRQSAQTRAEDQSARARRRRGQRSRLSAGTGGQAARRARGRARRSSRRDLAGRRARLDDEGHPDLQRGRRGTSLDARCSRCSTRRCEPHDTLDHWRAVSAARERSTLKVAFEQLGFGPCYHMVEVVQEPAGVGMVGRCRRRQAGLGQDLQRLATQCVDWPARDVLRASSRRRIPHAKVDSDGDASRKLGFARPRTTIFPNATPPASRCAVSIEMSPQGHRAVLFDSRMRDHDHVDRRLQTPQRNVRRTRSRAAPHCSSTT